MNDVNRFFRFGVVGVVGFIIDATLLSLLVTAGAGLYSARLVSFPCAVTVTWALNRNWSFKGQKTKRPIIEYGAYLGVQIAAALANLVTYAIALNQLFNNQTTMVIPALAMGAGIGLVINFAGAKALVFTAPATAPHQPDQ